MTEVILSKIAVMFIIMAIGFVCGKIGLIDSKGNKILSNVTLLLVNPLVMFVSYQREYSSAIAKNLFISLGISVLVMTLQIAIAVVLIPKKRDNSAIERLTVILTNCGFMGIPLVESVFGGEGVIYLSMYVTVFNVVAWTYGISQMTGKASARTTVKNLCTPAIFAIVLGLVFYFCRISLPSIIKEPLETIGNMNTPMAMLVAGATLSGTNIVKCLKKIRVYIITAVHLLAIPLIAAAILYVFSKLGISSEVLRVLLIAISCPSAVITTMFSHRYGKDSVYASELFAVSTLLSAGSIPLVMWLFSLMGV
ncbi:MAG: AEC family transporter [Ruminococcaceae bacterium]|nr:AEC family transporter [Oscillospiraceae bacterium]